MNRWSSDFLRVIFAFVIVLLAGFVSFSVRAAFHSKSDLITGITFFFTVVCLVRKRQPQTVLTAWLVEIRLGLLAITSKPSRVARPARSTGGLIGPDRAFAR
jgi:hypothetical protein